MPREERDLRSLFDKVIDTSEGFRTCCPRCGDEKFKLYWNEEKELGCCFHVGCQWLFSKGGITKHRLLAFMKQEGISYSYTRLHKVERPKEADIKLPEEFKLLDELEEGERQMVCSYLTSRGLRLRTLRRMKVGYCSTGKFWGYIIFPVMNSEGEVVYWQGRQYKQRKAKFYNPKASNKKEVFYQIGGGPRTRRVIIVESIINALTLVRSDEMGKDAVIALLGKTMSEQQRQHILSYERSLREIVVLLDPDAAKEAVSIAAQLEGYGIGIRLAVVPQGTDVNTLGATETWNRIGSAPLYNAKYPIGNTSALTAAKHSSSWLFNNL